MTKNFFHFLVIFFIFFFLISFYFFPSIKNNSFLLPLDIYQEYDSVFKIENFKAHNNLSTDIVLQFLQYRLLNEKYKGISFWNPFSLGGLPFFEDIQSRSLELTNLLANLLNIKLKYFFLFSAYLLLLLSGISMYFFLKELKIHKGAALSGAITFTFSSPVIIWINYTLGTTFIWLPFLFLCVEKIFSNKKIFYLLFSLAICFQLLAGHPQAAFLNIFFILSYIIFKFFKEKERDFKKFFIIITFLILGLTLSAVQTVPAFNFIKQSEVYQSGRSTNKPSFFEETRSQFSNINENLNLFKKIIKNRSLLLFKPNYYGNPVERNYNYPNEPLLNNYYETTSYVGIITIIIFLVSIIVLIKKKFYFWLFFLFFSFSLSINLPFINLFYYLPIINKINLGRLTFIFIFSLSVLFALAINYYLKRVKLKKKEAFFYLISVTIPIIIFIDLFFNFSFLFNNKNNVNINDYKDNKIIEFLQNSDYRHIGISDNSTGIHCPLIPNQSMLYNIYDLRGYFVMWPDRFFTLSKKYLSRRGNYLLADDIYSRNFLNIYRVKYIICSKEICKRYEQDYNVVKEKNNIKILENGSALPPAFITYNYSSYNNNLNKVYSLLENSSINIEENILIEKNKSNYSNIKGIEAVKINYIGTDKKETVFKAKEAGLLVVTDNYYQGWNVYVNGEKKEIMPVFKSLKGVLVEKGENKIEFIYRPKNFNIYLGISLFSLISLLFLYFYIQKKY